jgi:hypothetical protein
MKVHGVVVVDLSRITTATAAKAAIWDAICDSPPGADVGLVVPRWDWWPPFAVDMLLEVGEHLGSVTVESDAQTVRRWVVALRQASRPLQAVAEG